jgi:hypothetical protein
MIRFIKKKHERNMGCCDDADVAADYEARRPRLVKSWITRVTCVTGDCDGFAPRVVAAVVNVAKHTLGSPHAPRFLRHPCPYLLPTPTRSLALPLFAAWVSSLGHSIASARQPRWSFALYWAPIRVSSQHATVGTWISLVHSYSNLVSPGVIVVKRTGS